MTIEEAIEELMFQSGSHPDFENERWTTGFLGQLRPFKGVLHEENYHLVIRALKVLAPKLKDDFIDKRIISSIWGICHLGRMWALYPDGMLQSNKLLTKEQILQIDNWLCDISDITNSLLDDVDTDEAFWNYNQR